jgi:hypothetical protein
MNGWILIATITTVDVLGSLFILTRPRLLVFFSFLFFSYCILCLNFNFFCSRQQIFDRSCLLGLLLLLLLSCLCDWLQCNGTVVYVIVCCFCLSSVAVGVLCLFDVKDCAELNTTSTVQYCTHETNYEFILHEYHTVLFFNVSVFQDYLCFYKVRNNLKHFVSFTPKKSLVLVGWLTTRNIYYLMQSMDLTSRVESSRVESQMIIFQS